MQKNNHWSCGWDNINWELYSKVYVHKKDKDSTFLNININRLTSFFENRFNSNKIF